jgi:hypothetical protein
MTRSVSGSPLAMPYAKRVEAGKARNLYRRPADLNHWDDYLASIPAHWPAATGKRAAAGPYAKPGSKTEV